MKNLYQLSGVKIPVESGEGDLGALVAAHLGLAAGRITGARIAKESLDARKKPALTRVLQIEFEATPPMTEPLPARVTRLERSKLDIARPASLAPPGGRKPVLEHPVVVVGGGPAGLFAALAVAEAGLPVILLERGKPVETRMRDIGQLRSHGDLDPESNVCFGEGGAGAYTDGKLYTRIKHPHVRWVIKRLVGFGAPADILVKAHPHLGTDKLVRLLQGMRRHLLDRGVDLRFDCRVERLLLHGERAVGVVLADGSEVPAARVVMAIGHSARDTLANLHAQGVAMEAKPFAVGVRAEHPQAMVNLAQYGREEGPHGFGAAAYQLSHQIADPHLERRGVYSFCMCPGGFIVPSPTEPGHMAINGMSNANRSAPFANAGVVAQVTPEDLVRQGYAAGPLVGIAFQRDLERRAFAATKSAYRAPAMRIDDFVKRKASGQLAPTHFRPGAEPFDLWELLPGWLCHALVAGLRGFDGKIRGYVSAEGNLLAVESRTSSPVRLTRREDLQSVAIRDLYPVGEGAGYAGGIVSAAVDGLRAAECIIARSSG